jgi:hypothetical protein
MKRTFDQITADPQLQIYGPS